ncbi:MAG: excinuclease ABC subunit UvrA [Chitinophagales bacterium]|nr:excinuclease ABC subunit UvrA [Bacteroidota bacterium]MCB9043076.1 excinuclease ABC subunit UvrA [Chitinophagales bacterium]
MQSNNTPTTAETNTIQVEGARVHNLRNIHVSFDRNQLIVLTGISGSGKSSLAFDTLYAEGQRRYMESFSAYARQFLGGFDRPDVDKIEGLSPVVSIEQKTTSRNPRSTVGTVTEVYDFFRLMFARIGSAYSYNTGKPMVQYTEQQILDLWLTQFKDKTIYILAPVVRGRKGHYRELFQQIASQGFVRVRVDNELKEITPKMQLDRFKIHDIEVVVDKLPIQEKFLQRLRNSLATALKMGNGIMQIILTDEENTVYSYSLNLVCADTGIAYAPPSPNTFSFNSPYGACPHCKGLGQVYEVDLDLVLPDQQLNIAEGGIAPLGNLRDTYMFDKVKKLAKKYKFSLDTPIKKLPKSALDILLYGSENGKPVTEMITFGTQRWYNLEFEGIANMLLRTVQSNDAPMLQQWAEEYMAYSICPECNGTRLGIESLHFKIAEKNIAELAKMEIDTLWQFVQQIPAKLNERENLIAKDILKEINNRLKFLHDVGLSYLSLNRPASSLSGGESQRIRLATQIGAQLSGITYILDEPSIGLHQRDNQKLIQSLLELRDMDNTVIVVEHDKDIMLAADYVIDLGPGAGKMGGQVVAAGSPQKFMQANSLTAQYLSGKKNIAIPAQRRKGNGNFIEIEGAQGHNLKNLTVKFPLGTLIGVSGVSGSGKSSLIIETLYPILMTHFYKSRLKPLAYDNIKGLEHIDKVIEIDQSPIGRSPRSNAVTYIKVFDEIRKLYAQLPEAKVRGYKAGRFSFNVKGGRCETCQGGGMKSIEMNFLPDVLVQCETCRGQRYNRETLEVRYKGKSISDVLNMSVSEAVTFFEAVPKIYRRLKVLQEVGLGYINLGQSATTLSGGEAQRVKLAAELSKVATGKTFYILDEPTTGLHFEDIHILLEVLQKLVELGNTVLIIEHNLDVIKVMDYIIDLGTEGGPQGGNIVAQGTPEEIVTINKGYTAQFLATELND